MLTEQDPKYYMNIFFFLATNYSRIEERVASSKTSHKHVAEPGGDGLQISGHSITLNSSMPS